MPQVAISTPTKQPDTTFSLGQDRDNLNNKDSASTNTWSPADVPQLTVDVFRKDNSIFVVSTVAGIEAQDLDISIDNSTLVIKGVRKKPYQSDTTEVLLEECFWGEFYREITINENIDADRIDASLDDSILIIKIPVVNQNLHKKIQVFSGRSLL